MGRISLDRVPRKMTKAELIQVACDGLLAGDLNGQATDEIMAGVTLIVTEVADQIFKAKLNPRRVLSKHALGIMASAMEHIATAEEVSNDG